MGEIVAIRPGVSKKIMRKNTNDTHLRVAHYGDEVRMVETKIACIGYFVAPRHRAEFLKVLKFIQNDLLRDEASIRCVSICLDVLGCAARPVRGMKNGCSPCMLANWYKNQSWWCGRPMQPREKDPV